MNVCSFMARPPLQSHRLSRADRAVKLGRLAALVTSATLIAAIGCGGSQASAATRHRPSVLAALSPSAQLIASDQLRGAQRSAIRQYRPAAPEIDSAGPGPAGGAGVRRVPALDPPPAGPYLAVLKNAESEIAAHIGHPMGLPLHVIVNSKQVGTAFAYTYAYDSHGDLTGRPVSCVVYINPHLYHSLDSSLTNDALTHEMFHCFQAADYATLKAFYAAPAWLIEGSAAWVGQTLAPSPSLALSWWDGYLLSVGTPLFDMSYDAIGFFAHMNETGTDPWHLFDRMFKAPTSTAAYAIATDAEFKLTWASSLLRDTEFGEGWDTTGPAIPDGLAIRVDAHVLAPGQSLTGKVAPFTNDIVAVTTNANVLQFSVSTPYSRVHDSTTHDVDNLQTGPHKFCVNNCSASAELAALPRLAPGEVWLALTGNTGGATYSISATNDVPCLIGQWVTTNWSESPAEGGTISGGAGVHYTVTSDEANIDFTGMEPLGELTFAGQGTEALDYVPSTTATSGQLTVGEISGDVTLSVNGGPPITGTNTPVRGGSGTWSCSGDTMSWHLTNSTGSTVLDFSRST